MNELTTLFQNTADAIRSKTGDTAAMQASQFPAKIRGISVGISQDEADARYLQLAGGTMTGNLILNGAPTTDLQAATKKYVDEHSGQGGDEKTLIYSGQGSGTITPTVTFKELVLFKSFVFEVTATVGFNLTIDGNRVIETNYGGTYIYEAVIVKRELKSVNDIASCTVLVVTTNGVKAVPITTKNNTINCVLSTGTLKIYGVK